MKICLLARHFGLEGNGVGRVAMELYNGLVKRGYAVTKIEVASEELWDYFKFTAFDIPRRLPRDADVYHAISPMEAMFLPKRKSVVTFHDLFLMTNPDKTGAGLGNSKIKRLLGQAYWTFGCRRAIKHARFVTCNSLKTQQVIKKYLGADALVIPPGISPTLEPQPKRDNIFRFGYLGQLDKRKRVDLLVKAFHNLKMEDAELVIAGRGGEREKLEAMAEGDPRIKFVGFVPDNVVADFYNSLDVFMFPSALEGLGLPPIEAMACKKPVMILADAIIPEEVRKRCLIMNEHLDWKPDSIDLEDNYRFAKSHNWDDFVEKHLLLYEAICS